MEKIFFLLDARKTVPKCLFFYFLHDLEDRTKRKKFHEGSASFKCLKNKVGHFEFLKIRFKTSQNCVKRDFSCTNAVIFCGFLGLEASFLNASCF